MPKIPAKYVEVKGHARKMALVIGLTFFVKYIPKICLMLQQAINSRTINVTQNHEKNRLHFMLITAIY